jgi:hypothetical protein
LPRQIAKWLRQRSSQLSAAADHVETLEDNRKRGIIRKIVSDLGYLSAIIAQELAFESDGTLVPDQRILDRRAREAYEAQSEGGAV